MTTGRINQVSHTLGESPKAAPARAFERCSVRGTSEESPNSTEGPNQSSLIDGSVETNSRRPCLAVLGAFIAAEHIVGHSLRAIHASFCGNCDPTSVPVQIPIGIPCGCHSNQTAEAIVRNRHPRRSPNYRAVAIAPRHRRRTAMSTIFHLFHDAETTSV